MEWFSDWWNNLQLIEQILYCIAVPSSLILIIQIIMMLLGLGDGGEGINPSDTSGLDIPDVDFDVNVDEDFSGHDISNPSDISDFRLLSVQSVIAFLCIFGWSAITAIANNMSEWAAILLAAVLGLGAMFLVAKIIQWSSRLTQNGTFNIKNLLGKSGTVYIPIPPKGNGLGKINISCGERFLEYDAMNEGNEVLGTGLTVRVVDIVSGSVLVVEKL